MLRYMAQGERWWGRYPMQPHTRLNWEFYAVVRGSCGPLFDDGTPTELRSSYLWLFPPDTAHGWTGLPKKSCHIVTFSFGFVPEPIDHLVREDRWTGTALSAGEIRELLALEQMLRPPFQKPNAASSIYFHHALHRLSLIILRAFPHHRLPAAKEVVDTKVEQALAWYGDHMTEKPRLSDVATAVHVSPSHLRRLFWRARGENPNASLSRMSMQRAMDLLAGTDLKLEVISERCGFSCASDFCRAFRRAHGVSPTQWRQHLPKTDSRSPAVTANKSEAN